MRSLALCFCVFAVVGCTTSTLASSASAGGRKQEYIFDPGTGYRGWRIDDAVAVDQLFHRIKTFRGTRIRLRIGRDTPLRLVNQAIALAKHRGLKLLLTPTDEPRGGNSITGDPGNATPSASPAYVRDFAAWVGMLGRRYRGVKMWSIYNEPNLFLRKGTYRTTGDAYRHLYIASQRALAHAGHPPKQILIGETSPGGVVGDGGPVRFIKDVLKRGAKIRSGGWAHHAWVLGPRNAQGQLTLSSNPWDVGHRNRGDGSLGSADMPRFGKMLVRAYRRGATTSLLGIYGTEQGVGGDGPLAGVTYRALRKRMARFPYVKSVAQYLLYDEPGWTTGLLHADGSAKPQTLVAQQWSF